MKTFAITVREPNGRTINTEVSVEPGSFTRIARGMGVSRPAISKWLNNREAIPEWRYEQLLRLIGVSGPLTTSTTQGTFTFVSKEVG